MDVFYYVARELSGSGSVGHENAAGVLGLLGRCPVEHVQTVGPPGEACWPLVRWENGTFPSAKTRSKSAGCGDALVKESTENEWLFDSQRDWSLGLVPVRIYVD